MLTTFVLVGLALPNVCLGGIVPFASPAPLAAATAQETQALTFRIAEGTRLEKSFHVRTSTLSSDFRVFMGGQPVPSAFLPKLELTNEQSMTVELCDTYGKTKKGQLLSFVRDYTELAGEGSFSVEVPPEAPEESSWQRESPLAGERVAFQWDAKAGAFTRKLVGGGDPPEPLDILQARMDLTEFLPEQDVEVGASWEVDAALLAGLLNPGGPLRLDRGEQSTELPFETLSIEGELTVKLEQIAHEDGVRIAVLTIEGQCEQVAEREGDLTRVPVAEGEATDTATWNYDIEGSLRWNLDAGHALSLDLSGPFDHLLRTERDPGQGGADYASEIESDGDLEVEVRFTSVEDGRQ